jgi:hypothetical protein
VHGSSRNGTSLVEVYEVARSHERYRAAASEAYAIRGILNTDASSASAYPYYLAHLADADYSEAQLQSVAPPQATVCLHMMTNGVFTCVGKIHKARREGETQQWYYCTDCAWVYPARPGEVRREDLRDEGIVFIPLDATYPVPFADPARAVFWTRRVLLQQSFLITLTSAAVRLGMEWEAVQALCHLGVFHLYEHPNIPDEYVVSTLEIETYRNEERKTR